MSGQDYTRSCTVEASISAENTYSNWISLKGDFNLSLSGWVATVYIQRSFDRGVTPMDIESFTANVEKTGEAPEGAVYRFGIKTGGYTSGTLVGRLSQ